VSLFLQSCCSAESSTFSWKSFLASQKVSMPSSEDGPMLNCDDLPEANQFGFRKLKVIDRQKNGGKLPKPRTKLRVLPAVSETGRTRTTIRRQYEASYEDSEEYNIQHEPSPWRCDACTLTNNALLPCCEVCGADRTKIGAKNATQACSVAQVPLIAATPSLDWPPLPEAWEVADSWIDCDISSITSSWLDVDCADDIANDDDAEADIILVSDSAVQTKPSKSAGPPSWSAIVGNSPSIAKAPIQGVAVPPPISRQPAVRKHTKRLDEEDYLDTETDCLDARRVSGSGHHRFKKK